MLLKIEFWKKLIRCSAVCFQWIEEVWWWNMHEIVFVDCMTDKDVDQYIRRNTVWSKLPQKIRIVLGNSQREYDKLVLEYSIKNQLKYKGNIGMLLFCLYG